jgi:hypothetical protein
MQPGSTLETMRGEFSSLGFQSPASMPMVQARPITPECWVIFGLAGSDEFYAPVTGFTLPGLAAVVLRYARWLRGGPGPKDYDSRFLPILLQDYGSLLGEADPLWGPAAGKRRGQPMGPSEIHALAQSIDRFATARSDAGWTEDKVVEAMLAAPAMSPHGVMTRWIAPVWFAKRGAWSEFDVYAESLAIPPDDNLKHWREGLDVWARYAEKVRQHFGQPSKT